MVSKKIFASLLMLAVTVGASAQDLRGTTLNDRIGHGEDSLQVRQNLSLYQSYYKQRDWAECVEPWDIVFQKAPLAMARVYLDGIVIFRELYRNEQDAQKKQEYFDKMMAIYDQRLANLDALNSFATPKTFTTRGNIVSRKAFDYYSCCPNMDNETAYKLFRSGIDDMGMNTDGYIIYGFIECSYNRYMSDKENDQKRTDFINDFLECNDICDNLLDQAKEYAESDSVKAMQIVNAYLPTKDRCGELFVTSEAADCGILERIYAKGIEENKDNVEYLDAVLKVMEWFKCADSEVYFKASDLAYAIKPTPRAAIAKATRLTELKRDAEAIKYMEAAIDMEEDVKAKARYAHSVARMFFEKKQYVKAHQWCKKSYGYDPTYGWAYLYDASCISRVPSKNQLEKCKNFCLAYDKVMRAKAVDPACTAAVNKVAQGYRDNWYPKTEAFFRGFKEGTTIQVLGENTIFRFNEKF